MELVGTSRCGIAARGLYGFVELLQEDFQTEVRVKAVVAKAPQTCQSFLFGISLAQDLNHDVTAIVLRRSRSTLD
jgi:hypothetical protein